jgi:hypothetical protein
VNNSIVFLIGLFSSSACLGRVFAAETGGPAAAAMQTAWSEWTNGNVLQAELLAEKQTGSDESKHLLVLCSYVKGEYKKSLARYATIAPLYEKRRELEDPVVQAYLHLGRFGEARDFAREQKMSSPLLNQLELRASHPLKTHLDKITVVPFAQHPLKSFFPAFEAELEGQKTTIHVDTGGTFLTMGPDRAKALGIELVDAGKGFQASTSVPLQMGVAKSLVLGDATLNNVPVIVMPTLTGAQDFVIFGTNVLEPFLATLDYPDQRLILSPRNDEALRDKHMAMLSGEHKELSFYMWGDHYMFARGGFGTGKALNFFIDSGLVALSPEKAGLRQACFTTTAECFQMWDVGKDATAKEYFESPRPISLGPIAQTNQFFVVTKNPSWLSFGGVRIDGLLGHGFLSKYAWTLDFDRRQYRFSEPR